LVIVFWIYLFIDFYQGEKTFSTLRTQSIYIYIQKQDVETEKNFESIFSSFCCSSPLIYDTANSDICFVFFVIAVLKKVRY